MEEVAGEQIKGIVGVGQSVGKGARRLAWSTWIISVLFLLSTLILAYQNDSSAFMDSLPANVLDALVLFSYATVGVLIATRQAANPIGWIFCAAALLVSFGVFAEDYAQYALLTRPGSLPAGDAMVWLAAWPRNVGFSLMFTFLPLLFPNGKLPSRRWRSVAWLAAAAIALGVVVDAFKPGPLPFNKNITNPLGIAGAGDFFELYSFIWTPSALIVVMVCVSAVIVRFRRAEGHERQQLKWFAYASALAIFQFVVSTAFTFLPVTIPQDLPDLLLVLSIAAFPIATGIAILRYRLYDIDLLINRTLVYVPLTGILAGVYSASIALFQKIFQSFTGEQSAAAIVITTLILASSFTPIKNALQTAVDKRFKEAPDPTKKLRAFGDQVKSFVQLSDSDQLTRRLLDEVISAFGATGGVLYLKEQEQLQPVHISEAWSGDALIDVPLQGARQQLGLVSLGARRNGLDYTPQDRKTLEEIANTVAQAVEMSERTRLR